MADYDSIIIGAGHNGLVCAAYLARAGQRVLVLEAEAKPGGLAATREFHPGFSVSVAHTLYHFSKKVVQDLDLTQHGYTTGEAIATVGLAADGQHISILGDRVQGVSDKDAAAFTEYQAMLRKFAATLDPFWMKTMPRIGNNSLKEMLTFAQVGLKLRLLGAEDMREFFRVASLPVRDLMDENYDSELLKAVLSWDAVIGSTQAPRSPNNTVLTMLYRMTGESSGAHAVPAGGMAGLINALAAAAEAQGAELRYNAPVKRIDVHGDENGQRATGVVLANGDALAAENVISATDPKRTFFDLLGAQHLEIEFTNRIRRLRTDGQVAKLHLALSGLPAFTGVESPDGRMIIAPQMDSLEFAWDDAKYGHLPAQPALEVLIPTLREPGLAPAGQHVLSAHVMYVPRSLEGSWTDAARAELQGKLMKTLARYAPGIEELVLHAELLTPEDLEQQWHVTGGHWHHTELAMDQMLMMRPTYEAAQHSTPIPGLYLCGAGCHPGGGVMGGPGHNAAGEILR
ncbi:MAG: NAD(P)/FAD-dependent oxidoreductase [Halieaceae bacterium]|nr:NAD(P)/FAD-dependent oxidoreductase [Halieaceae bacterium]